MRNYLTASASGSAAVGGTAQGISGFGFSAAQIAAAQAAVLSAGSAQARVLWDGSTPTATFGHPIPANDTLTIEGQANVANVAVVQDSAPSVMTCTLETD